jgi:hypothetical protein
MHVFQFTWFSWNDSSYTTHNVTTIFSFLSSGKTPFYYHISFKVNNIDYDSNFAKPYSQEYMDLNKRIASLVSWTYFFWELSFKCYAPRSAGIPAVILQVGNNSNHDLSSSLIQSALSESQLACTRKKVKGTHLKNT